MQIETLAKNIRKDLIKYTKDGLIDTLGSTDIFAALFTFLDHTPFNKKERITCSPKLYNALKTTLAHTGHFSKNQLQTQKEKPNESLATAAGRALGLLSSQTQVYHIMRDEDHTGLTWDAIHFAGHHKLSNLRAIIDRNNLQPNGDTETNHTLEPLKQKYEAFGWNVLEVDGHHIPHLLQTLAEAQKSTKPCAIIAHTTGGKGIPQIENRHEWIHKQPTEIQKTTFLEQLK